MDKFKDCLATQNKAFEYDIEIDGKVFATARVKSPLALGKIEDKSQTKRIDMKAMTQDIDINSQRMVFYTVLYSLISWKAVVKGTDVAVPLTEEGVEYFATAFPDTYAKIFAAIVNHESELTKRAEGNAKN